MLRILITSTLLCAIFLFGQSPLKLDKDGKPLTGKITTEESSITYKNGRIMEKIIKDEYSDKPLIIEKYDNDLLISIEYFNFLIKNKLQKSYKGIYKEGEKHEGFFLGNPFIDQYKMIDFYENGKLKYQYSFDYLKQGEKLDSFVYDFETEFRNGKIFKGYDYKILNGSVVLRTDYKDSTPISFDLDVFAMHYFNRISVANSKGLLTVKDLDKSGIIKVTGSDNKLLLEKFDAEEKSLGTAVLGESTEVPNSIVIYYLKDKQLKNLTISNLNLYSDLGGISDTLLNQMFSFSGNKIDDLFKYLLDQYQNNFVNLTSEFEQGFPFKNDDVIANLRYDNKGKPFMGVKIIESTNGYNFEVFDKGANKSSGSVKTHKELKDRMDQVLKSFQ